MDEFQMMANWWDEAHTYLKIHLTHVSFGMSRDQVQSLIDGLTLRDAAPGYVRQLDVPLVTFGSNGDDSFPVYFNGFDFTISKEEAAVLVPVLRERLDEPPGITPSKVNWRETGF